MSCEQLQEKLKTRIKEYREKEEFGWVTMSGTHQPLKELCRNYDSYKTHTSKMVHLMDEQKVAKTTEEIETELTRLRGSGRDLLERFPPLKSKQAR